MSYAHMGLTSKSHTTLGAKAYTSLNTGCFKSQTAKSPTLSNRASLNRSLAMSYSHMGTPTLPSAQLRFTSEFGKGSGGTTALLSLNKKGTILESLLNEH